MTVTAAGSHEGESRAHPCASVSGEGASACPAYDPRDQRVLADPFSAYAELRRACPVHLDSSGGVPSWVLSRHGEVKAVLADPQRWSSALGHGPGVSQGSLTLAYTDDPAHAEQRRLVNRAFTASSVAAMEPRVRQIAHELVDGFVADGRADLHDVVATPLPIRVIAEMLGVPSGRMADFKRWSDDSVARLASGDSSTYARSAAEFRDFFAAEIRWRSRAQAAGEELPDDLISRLVSAEDRGVRLDEDQALGMIGQLLTAGNETTTSLILNLVWRLCEYPDQLAALGRDPSLAEVAVEESLRFDPPVLGLWRTPTRDTELGGNTIAADHKTQVLFASANRDPEVWDDPDEFRLDRPLDQLRQHLSFGFGTHFCLGAALARLEARVALEVIIERLPGLRLDGPSERVAPFFLWGRRSLPVAWDRDEAMGPDHRVSAGSGGPPASRSRPSI